MRHFSNLIKNPYFFLSWLLLAGISYQFLDKDIAIYLNHVMTQSLSAMTQYVTMLGVNKYYISLSLIAGILALLLRKRIWFYRFGFVFLTVAISSAICDVLKTIFGRSRPSLFFSDHPIYGFYFFHTPKINDYFSFPSGHAATAAAVMTALAFMWPRKWLLFLLVFFLIILSRLMLDMHFLSDVMMGAYLGAFTSVFLYGYVMKKYINQ